MQVLVVGSGGREHALAWKLARSEKVDKIFVAPGNAGTAMAGENVPIAADDRSGLLEFARDRGVDLTVVGPEAPLVSGIVDMFNAEGQRIFGFDSRGSLLEGSKVWAKEFMHRYGIPTGSFMAFKDHCSAQGAIDAGNPPFVVKADGLAAGKGVLICTDKEQARRAVESMMR